MSGIKESTVVHALLTKDNHHFHEGSSMRRFGNVYNFVFADSSRGKPTCLGYATSTSPLGPFTYRRVIIDNAEADPYSWNNHGSIEQVNGSWYIFCHGPSRCSPLYRRLCVEPITIAADGSIMEIKMISQGIGEPFGSGEQIDGWRACAVSGGIYVGLGSDNRDQLLNAGVGSSAKFRYVQSGHGFQRATLDTTGDGTIQVFMNSLLVGTTHVRGDGKCFGYNWI
ncbi:hypothetical protein BHE90_007574 [Fusarium euwallaceae]|uniref:Uncharacterized protein n=1 Tax=Fusarium euwallaceae TaxID=1147111 RepID=A0A430LQB4_9HYPO|nr:hypothetical protein BHE90_007574 [Fusarium euwallaceae]